MYNISVFLKLHNMIFTQYIIGYAMITPANGSILLNTRYRIWHLYGYIALVLEVYGCGSSISVGSVHSWNVFHITYVFIISRIISGPVAVQNAQSPCIVYRIP